jgi:hypothetical protein
MLSLCGQEKLFVLWFLQGHPNELAIVLGTNTRKKKMWERLGVAIRLWLLYMKPVVTELV